MADSIESVRARALAHAYNVALEELGGLTDGHDENQNRHYVALEAMRIVAQR